MFWLARLIKLERPMPPTPTAAMFNVSLGGVNPRPRTLLGTMVNPAPPAATLVRNVRRENAFFLVIDIPPCRDCCVPATIQRSGENLSVRYPEGECDEQSTLRVDAGLPSLCKVAKVRRNGRWACSDRPPRSHSERLRSDNVAEVAGPFESEGDTTAVSESSPLGGLPGTSGKVIRAVMVSGKPDSRTMSAKRA